MYVAKYDGKKFVITYVNGKVKGGMRARTLAALWRMVKANRAYIRDMSNKGRTIFVDYSDSAVARLVTRWVDGTRQVSISPMY